MTDGYVDSHSILNMKTLLIISFFFCTSVFAGKRNDLTIDNPNREDDLIEECLENKDLPYCRKNLKKYPHLCLDRGSPNRQY